MTDDLTLRLRNCYNLLEDEGHYVKANTVHLAIDRIEALEKEITEANAAWEQTSIMLGRQLARASDLEAKLAKAVEALLLARVHVANNEQGWSVGRASARSDLEIINATLTEIEGDKP